MKVPDEDEGASHKLMPIPQRLYGRTFKGNGVHRPENEPTGDYPPSKMFDLNKYPATAKTDPPDIPAAIFRPADVESDMAKEAPREKNEMPKVRYVTTGDVWWGFWGGIGKGIAQTISDMAIDSARIRHAVRGGIYRDIEKPNLFGPPTISWDDTGRKIASGVMATVRPVSSKPKTWNGKIIGKVAPPKHLKPGTVPFGNDMHEKVSEFLKESYPHTEFHIRVKRGQTGPDMGYKSGLKPSDEIEIKSNKPHSQKQLNRQILNWGYPESAVRVFTYDEHGNIYDGFGFVE